MSRAASKKFNDPIQDCPQVCFGNGIARCHLHLSSSPPFGGGFYTFGRKLDSQLVIATKAELAIVVLGANLYLMLIVAGTLLYNAYVYIYRYRCGKLMHFQLILMLNYLHPARAYLSKI